MAPQQPSRRFGSVAQRDRGRGYERRAQAGFQQTPRFEYRKNLVGEAQMEPGQVDISGPVRSAMEAQQRQQRQQRAAGASGGSYGRSAPVFSRQYSRQQRFGNTMVVQGSSQRRGGGLMVIGGLTRSGGVPGGERGYVGGVQAPGASTTYRNGRITTKWGHVPYA